MIGFHTYDYARHFLSSCSRLLGVKCTPNKIELVGRHATVGTFPIGIEPGQFLEALQEDQVQQRVATLRRRFEGVKLIVGVDRLDYIKGVPQKLHAMEVFLEEHPEWIGKVVLVQVAVPSRQDVEEYQNLRAMVNELVGRINGRFGTVDWMPIHFMHRSVPFSELTALYTVSDACLITSTRDGMNLVRPPPPCPLSSGRPLTSTTPAGRLRVHRVPAAEPWRPHPVRVCRRRCVPLSRPLPRSGPALLSSVACGRARR